MLNGFNICNLLSICMLHSLFFALFLSAHFGFCAFFGSDSESKVKWTKLIINLINNCALFSLSSILHGSGDFLLHPYRKPKRIRTAFAPLQLLELENAFEGNQYVVGSERKALAKTLNLTETQVRNELTIHNTVLCVCVCAFFLFLSHGID